MDPELRIALECLLVAWNAADDEASELARLCYSEYFSGQYHAYAQCTDDLREILEEAEK